MRLVEKTLLELNATFDGDPWHGTPIRRILDSVDLSKLHARPIPDGNSIAMLIGHVTAWIEIAQLRLTGETVDATAEMDFPDVTGTSFDELTDRLQAAHSLLVDTVARMSDDDFDAIVPGTQYTSEHLLRGVVHHTIYHSGQIALLAKL